MVAVPENKYKPRLIDRIVEQHLKAFGGIEIAGTMWSGKTWTALEHGASAVTLDNTQARQLAEMAPEALLAGERPRVIDEWQLVPSIWDTARHQIDQAAGERGLFILTGSSRPSKGEVHHTGSGRISRLKMRPMSLQETGESSGVVSLSALFDGVFEPCGGDPDLFRLAHAISRGGWPGSLDLEPDLATLVPTQYVDALVTAEDTNAPESEDGLRRFLQALARNMGSAPKINTLVQDMRFTENDRPTEMGRRKTQALIEYFANRFVIEPSAGWDAPIKSPSRLRVKPRYDFADPSIPCAILGLNEQSILGNMQVFGQLFEQLCLRDLRVYASVMPQAKPDTVHYYRDADNLEVDAIVELRDGRWAGIEIKLGANKVPDAESSLLRLKKKIAANPFAQNAEPSFLMVLVGAGEFAYQLPSGVYVVPIRCLGA